MRSSCVIFLEIEVKTGLKCVYLTKRVFFDFKIFVVTSVSITKSKLREINEIIETWDETNQYLSSIVGSTSTTELLHSHTQNLCTTQL